nr:glycosyltransferase family 4 protein [Massilia sp. YIM B04103]
MATVAAVLEQEGFFARRQVRYVITHADGSRWYKAGLAWRAALQIVRARLADGPVLVHAHVASRGSFWRKSLLLAVARGCGCPTVFHLHGGEFRQFALAESGPLRRWWIRRTLERSAAVITLSGSSAAFLRDFAPRAQVQVIANSVPVPAAVAPAAEAGRILFLGRAHRPKGIYELLEAVALLRQDWPALRLVIGGDGDLAAVAQRARELQIEAQVEIAGWLDAAQKAEQIRRAQLFCLPSYAEGLPMAMLEAMAAGKPVVVTPVGGIPEAVSDGQNGLLVPPRDAAALAQALRRLLGDAALRARLAQQARQTVLGRYATEAVMGQLGALYDAVAVPAR